MQKGEKPTIGMLLDVQHFYGEHEKRMGPMIMTLLIGGAPILLYVYFGLFVYIPVWLFIIAELLFAVYIVLLIPGRQSYRVRIFRRRLFDNYTAAADMLGIKTIHPDGCIEYTNGQVTYLVVGLNGTTEDVVTHSIEMRKFMSILIGEFMFDLYIHNINTTPSLSAYYDKVHNMGHTEVASNFVDILDENRQQTENKSKVQCIIFAIRGRRSDWKDMAQQIDSALLSDAAKVFKTVYRVNSAEEVNSIINRDTDTYVAVSELLRLKHKTGQYDTSRVLTYDTPREKEITLNSSKTDSNSNDRARTDFHVRAKR